MTITVNVQVPVSWRTRLLLWRQRARERRHAIVSLAYVLTGMAGALGGAAIIGMWCLGLVMMAESAGLLFLGLNRDDGISWPKRGARTVPEILEDEAAMHP